MGSPKQVDALIDVVTLLEINILIPPISIHVYAN
jgi:hypothetical protein